MSKRRPFSNKEISAILDSFHGRFQHRNAALIALGTEAGFRISELLTAKRKDVIEIDGELKETLTLMQSKVKKLRTMYLNEIAKHYLSTWLKEMEVLGNSRAEDYIFIKNNDGRVMSRVAAWKIIKNACQRCGIRGATGTHSMRKSFAKNIWEHTEKREKNGEKVDKLMMCKDALGHANISSTEHYLNFLVCNPKPAVMSRTLDSLKNT
jgi:site-specific recombinase XerD